VRDGARPGTQFPFGVRATDAAHHASHRSLALAQRQSDDDTDDKRARRFLLIARAHDPAKCERFADKIMR
jgi:hypothetical protein